MDLLKPPTGLLELGNHIVNQLDLYDSMDTLGRWMAHYLAELIESIEKEEDKDEKRRVQQEVTELIIKLWDKRAALPANIDPIKKYQKCLDFLEKISPEIGENNNAFFHIHLANKDDLSNSTRDFVTKFNKFMSAIICKQLEDSILPGGIALSNISDTEHELIEALEDAKEKTLKENESFKEAALTSCMAMQEELLTIIAMLEGDKKEE